jgi:hypothetical protein
MQGTAKQKSTHALSMFSNIATNLDTSTVDPLALVRQTTHKPTSRKREMADCRKTRSQQTSFNTELHTNELPWVISEKKASQSVRPFTAK